MKQIWTRDELVLLHAHPRLHPYLARKTLECTSDATTPAKAYTSVLVAFFRPSPGDPHVSRALLLFLRRALSMQLDASFSPGTHVVTDRILYAHHGIYVGNGRVVHYAGLCDGWESGAVEEVSLERFANGERVVARAHSSRSFSNAEIVARARSRLGENMYHILRNNCEHFCQWCVTGRKRSWQVHKWMFLPFRLLRAVFRWVSTHWSRPGSPSLFLPVCNEATGGRSQPANPFQVSSQD
ncbi:MAG TPA: lecithin retinol acyltransferase family protein [Casimicrobiaceae bacterium]|nr:lecithin retinol acyltransferase family protein [Casimicrobiaceae bacterium]